MTAKITFEIANLRLQNKFNGNIVLLEYSGIKNNAKFECLRCGNIWKIGAFHVINNGNDCQKCSKKPRKSSNRKELSFNSVKEIIENAGCKLISKTYEKVKQKLDILLPCEHIVKMSLSEFYRRGKVCKQCRRNNFYKNRYPENSIIDLVESYGFKFIKFVDGYKDGSSKMEYSCQCDHVTRRDVKYFIKFPTCYKCQKIDAGKRESGENGPGWRGGVSKLSVAARARLDPWMNDSLKNADFKCYLTGATENIDVHHLTAFNTIVEMALSELKLDKMEYLKDYGGKVSEEVLAKIVEVNNRCGYGLVISKSIHMKFHGIYGHGWNNSDQWHEFEEKYKKGEITID